MLQDRDPKFIARLLVWWRPLSRHVFRCRVHGMDRLTEGPYLLVANHNIAAPVEILALIESWHRHHPEKPAYGMTHFIPMSSRRFSPYYRKAGSIPATYEAAHHALGSGHSVLVFPGGNYESMRPFSQRHLCDFGGHRGWARIALSRGVPVVPISIVGSHAINPVLIRARFLSKLFIVPEILKIKWFPITPAQLLYPLLAWFALGAILPWWLVLPVCYWIFLFSFLWPVWPSKVTIQVHEPMRFDPSQEEAAVQSCYAAVTAKIQEGMDRLRS